MSVEDTSAPPSILIADHFAQPAGYHVRRAAGTRDWLITYTCDGAGRYGHRRGAHQCEAGEIVLLSPGAPHDYGTAQDVGIWDFYWAHFTPRVTWLGWLKLPELSPGLSALAIDNAETRQRIEHAFERLISDSRGAGAFRGELALNALEEITLVAAQNYTQSQARRLDPRIEAVIEHLSTHLDTPISVPALARSVALSPSRLAHLFKAEVGDSIARAHMKLRLRHAARLLEFTTRQISEIAHDVGFQSPFYFSHQFKAHYGMSPTAYRERLVGTNDGGRRTKRDA
jgi:AraC family transcriptional regulator of arabinose operon